MRKKIKIQDWHIGFLILTLLVIEYTLQLNYDVWSKYSKPVFNATYNETREPNVINSELIKKFSFGYDNLISDIYWLSTIQYYGGGDPYGGYAKLPNLLNSVVDLNPKFQYPYIFSLLVLPNEKMADQALTIGEKGRTALPDDWQIPYYMGTVYHIDKKDYKNAGKYLEIAAGKPGVLPIAKLLAATYYAKANERDIAYNLYKVIYENSQDEYTKEKAGNYLKNLEIISFLEDAAKHYKIRYGHYPLKLQDLVNGKILTAIPESPINRELIIDPNSGKVSEKN